MFLDTILDNIKHVAKNFPAPLPRGSKFSPPPIEVKKIPGPPQESQAPPGRKLSWNIDDDHTLTT